MADNQEYSPQHLSQLGKHILAHWQEFRPKMCKELEAQGKLREMVFYAQEKTAEEMEALWKQGLPHDRAWELARQKWAFLPDEEDEPNPPNNPLNWSTTGEPQSPETTASPNRRVSA